MSNGNQAGPAPTAQPGKNYAETIVSEARKPFVLNEDPSGVMTFAIPTRDGFALQHHDPEALSPKRAKGAVYLDTLESFLAYVNVMKPIDAATARIYCQADFETGAAVIVAVLNDDSPSDGAQYRDYRAVYKPKLSVEWLRWARRDEDAMGQEEFATFVENNLRDIATIDGLPDGSAMFKMALAIEITKDSRFRSAIRPQSGGVLLEYVDREDEATAKQMAVFDRFALGIAPFFGGEAYRVDARLRYRLQAGALRFWYELIRPDLALADAIKGELTKIGEATGLMVLMGRPE